MSADDTALPRTEKVAAIARGGYRGKSRCEIRASGYVAHILEAALWAFASTDTFRDGALLAVNFGEDADTTGVVYGQIAGAFYGVDAIPGGWRARLAHREFLEDLAERLLERFTGYPG